MSRFDYVIADSDLHVMEPPDLWQRYIDPAFKHAAPVALNMSERGLPQGWMLIPLRPGFRFSLALA